MLFLRERGEGKLAERHEQILLGVLSAATSERQQRGEGGFGVLLIHGAALPKGDVLAFDRDARGIADEAIGAVQVRPGDVNGSGVFLSVKSFELMTQRTGLGSGLLGLGIWILGFGFGCGRFAADIGDAIEAGLRAAAAGGKIHRAITTKFNVRHVQCLAFD